MKCRDERLNSASLSERTATKRQKHLLGPLGGMYPCKLIHFPWDFDRWAAIRSLFMKYNYQTSRSKLDTDSWNERTAIKRKNDLLVPLGRVFPRKLIQFLEDFDRTETNRTLFSPATNITEEGGLSLLIFEKSEENERLLDELIWSGARPALFQYSWF